MSSLDTLIFVYRQVVDGATSLLPSARPNGIMHAMMKDSRGFYVVNGLTFDPAKKYRYTWPGGSPQTVTADEMAAIAESSDPRLLGIEEFVESKVPFARDSVTREAK